MRSGSENSSKVPEGRHICKKSAIRPAPLGLKPYPKLTFMYLVRIVPQARRLIRKKKSQLLSIDHQHDFGKKMPVL
jgi:hypothetical protein